MGSLLFEPFFTPSFASKARYRLHYFKEWCLVSGSQCERKRAEKQTVTYSVHQTDDFNCKCTIFVVLSAFHLLSSSRSLTHSVHLLLIRSKQIITAGCCLCCVALHMLELLLSADTKLHLRLFPAPTPPEIPRHQCHSPLTLILLVKFNK